MSIARRLVLAVPGALLLCALLALAASGPALAAPRGSTERLLAQERYLSSFATGAASSGPSPEERYYSSYGEPQAVAAPLPAPASNEVPWLAVAVAVAAGASVAIVAMGATRLRRLRAQGRPADPTPPSAGILGEQARDLAR